VPITAELAVVATGAFFAALVMGSAGFAFALVVTGFWIYVLPPAAIVFLAAVCSLPLHAFGVWQFRREIEYRLLWPFLAGGVLGVPVGVQALQHIDLVVFRHLVGAFMIAYGGYGLLRSRPPVVRLKAGMARVADGLVGWAGGVLGGLALLNGVLPTIWCGLRGWDKRRARRVYQPYILATGVLIMLLVGFRADVDTSRLGLYLLICMPALAAGLWLGLRVFEWISEEHFRRLVLWLLLASGISLQF